MYFKLLLLIVFFGVNLNAYDLSKKYIKYTIEDLETKESTIKYIKEEESESTEENLNKKYNIDKFIKKDNKTNIYVKKEIEIVFINAYLNKSNKKEKLKMKKIKIKEQEEREIVLETLSGETTKLKMKYDSKKNQIKIRLSNSIFSKVIDKIEEEGVEKEIKELKELKGSGDISIVDIKLIIKVKRNKIKEKK